MSCTSPLLFDHLHLDYLHFDSYCLGTEDRHLTNPQSDFPLLRQAVFQHPVTSHTLPLHSSGILHLLSPPPLHRRQTNRFTQPTTRSRTLQHSDLTSHTQTRPTGTVALSSYRAPEAHYVDNTIVYKHKSRRSNHTDWKHQPSTPFLRNPSSPQLTAPAKRVHFAPEVIQQSSPRTPRSHTSRQSTMCSADIYTDVLPDGRTKEYQEPSYCAMASRSGRPCPNPVIYNHPPRSVSYPSPMPTYPTAGPSYPFPQQMPPTPPMSSPRGTSAGTDADRIRRDSSSSERRRRQSGVYINGQKVLDLNRKSRTRAERIVIVDSPPTPRTPPKQFSSPYTAPPSPNAGGSSSHFQYNHVPRDSFRPIIVDERAPRSKVEIEVVDSGHHRHNSSDSRYSHASAGDEERRRRRRERERERERQEREERERQMKEEQRQERKRAQIAAQNADISRRTAVPFKRTSTGFGPSLADQQREQELVDAVRRLEIADRRAREAREAREREEEDEAQRHRLMERMMPRRRATVGPGSRRHRVLYDDGVYRWE
ncbi:hypothetical protein CTA2_596 [Colletotrichum tanaceti]|uniref:Uncharacterized protein n=1 Tax=Colletotrichum tanaceti TaxID=1306861 RepID=A0A4U6X6Q0_9PEZI|nr:hypothetical protein CTA2_596 [Colletotrichum tanaceti]TKW50774.1 hypothetical protein CTA1_11809 [Colletotrichum tanaceti]